MWFVRFWRLCSFRAPNGNGAGFGDKAPGMVHNRFLKVWGALVGLSFGEPGTAFTFATECGFKSLRFWFVAWCLLKQDSCQRKKIKKKWARIVPIAYSILQLAKIHKSLTSQHRSTQVAYGILICANTDTEPNGGRLCQMWKGIWHHRTCITRVGGFVPFTHGERCRIVTVPVGHRHILICKDKWPTVVDVLFGVWHCLTFDLMWFDVC